MKDGNTILDRKKRWLDLLDPTGKTRFLYTVFFEEDPEIPPRPWPQIDNVGERQEWALRKYNTMAGRMEWLHDDSLPFLDLFTGTEIFAQAFGCDVHYSSDNMPFALPLATNSAEASKLVVPSLESTPLYTLILDAVKMRDRAGSDALVRLPDIQTPMDIAALIWAKESFYIALIEEPEAVLELAGKTGRLLTDFMDAWFEAMGPEYIAHYPDYYMSGGITVSEDEIGAVSPDCFDTLFLPELVALSERYGHMGLHCCAHARHQWPGFLKIPGLRLLNLIQPVEVLREAFDYFADTCAQLHVWSGDGPAWDWPAQYADNARVVMTPRVGSREEAIEVCERLAPICRGSDIMKK